MDRFKELEYDNDDEITEVQWTCNLCEQTFTSDVENWQDDSHIHFLEHESEYIHVSKND